MTLSDLEWPFHASRAISAVAEVLVSVVEYWTCEGDHIMMDDGLSGIVVGVGEKMSQLEVIRFPSEDHRGPGVVVINNIARQYNLHNAYSLTSAYCGIFNIGVMSQGVGRSVPPLF